MRAIIRHGRAVLLLVVLGVAARAAQQGEFFHEDQNIPAAERFALPTEDLLFRLRSEAGVTAGDDGAVQSWADQSGHGLDFTATANAEPPPRLVANVVAGKPAVAFVHTQHRAPGLRSAPVTIDPNKGMTMLVLARSTAPVHIGYLLGYGPTYQTRGALAMYLAGQVSYQRAILQVNVGLDAEGKDRPALDSSAGNVSGRGFVIFATRFDPATGEQTLYEDEVEVGRVKRAEPLAETHQFAIGCDVRGTWSFTGEILTALAYNRALAPDELAAVQRSLLAEYGLGGKPISAMAHLLPFAYYPSRNQMEVALELSPELLAKAGTPPPAAVQVRVLAAKTERLVATGEVPLDGQARGQDLFAVPDLPDGEYAVEYVIGQHVERSPKTFQRIHFPFEKERHGLTREVFPPFVPVQVSGRKVAVVGRTYTVNAQGLFDSVVSLDRELLAAPMKLVAESADGSPVDWRTGWFASGVKGQVVHPDEAVFKTRAKGSGIELQGVITVQEDGCAKIALTIAPESAPVPVHRLWLEIPFRDAEVPLFHYIADNGMRFNHAGDTPRGGRIEWYREPWDGWVPIRWRVAEPGPDDGVIWTAADTHQHGNTQRWDHRPFVPYLWLGAEERGLAFFMESEQGFATDYRTPLQQVIRQGDQVVVRVEIFQQPVMLAEPRTIVFGLMASPGKPLEPEFRTRPFASGVGPVSCWGGWQCASKYPDNRDWSIVDKIQEIRRRGQFTDEDKAWFEAKNQEVVARWPDRHLHHDPKSRSWLWLTTHFAQRAAENGHPHSGVYFEEHATDTLKPEWQVFQDEWASAEFNRFRDRPANWGVFSPSYHDFVLYMANEWMKRGVSLYYDNTNPKRCYNERFGPAFRTPSGALVYGISIFGQREYYRRIYKLLREWNVRGAEYPIDFTIHITNTQTIPFNTWSTATLDLEQRAHTENPAEVPPEVPELKGGYQLPWPPDYTRTITFGRQAGVIPMGLDFVSGHGRHESNHYTQAMILRDWAMRRIHDVRNGGMWMSSARLAVQYHAVMADFGYGRREVDHHSYWAEKPLVTVSDDRLKWLALTRPGTEPFGLLLMQSYSRTEAIDVEVVFPGAAALLDIETRELIPAAVGQARLVMPANFATRMFLVSRDAANFAALARPAHVQVADFALNVPVGFDLRIMDVADGRNRSHEPQFLSHEGDPARRFWRLPAGMRNIDLASRQDHGPTPVGDLSLRLRLPEIPAEAHQHLPRHDALVIQWRRQPAAPDAATETVQTTIRCAVADGKLQWLLTRPQLVRDQERTPLVMVGETEEPKPVQILGEGGFNAWAAIGFRQGENRLTVQMKGHPALAFDLPPGTGGGVVVSQGNLLAAKLAPHLDLDDIVLARSE